MKFSSIDTPDKFLAAFPTDLQENIDKRQKLHGILADDVQAQEHYMQMCLAKPQIAFNSALWTYDPRRLPGYRNQPFILRPKQSIFIDEIKSAIETEHDLIADKSREEGATEVICKMFVLYWWLWPETSFLVGSRKEQLVDNSVEFKDGRLIGPHQCLFHKIMYGITNLPAWVNINFSKKHGFLQNLDNNSTFEGESTNESFGAGNRATGVLVDEVARIEPDVAQYIIDNIHDTSPCCIYNSTHFRWGAGHPYARLLRSNRIKTVTLGFEDNPAKNKGMYKSPDLDVIEILDIDYYRNICPEVFNDIEPSKAFTYSEFEKKILTYPEEIQDKCKNIKFVADGGETNFNRDRSVWFDAEEARGRSKTDIAQNILRIPQGSADMFFDEPTVHRIRSLYQKPPRYRGRLKFDIVNGVLSNFKYVLSNVENRFKWWGPLRNGQPNIANNYIVGCDISRGTGASNSVMAICDVNKNELIGIYANPFIDVTDFAELAVATCKWLGGAYLIWEANGPGDTFDKRVWKLGYNRVYINKNERKMLRKRSQTRGWRSTPGVNGSKMDMLSYLDVALSESIKTTKYYRYITIHDEALINELEDYMFMPGRVDINLSNAILDESGAKYAHGDRVIATGLCVLGMREQRPANLRKKRVAPSESFQSRFQKWEEENEETKRSSRRYRYK
jgi:hypothetical protein